MTWYQVFFIIGILATQVWGQSLVTFSPYSSCPVALKRSDLIFGEEAVDVLEERSTANLEAGLDALSVIYNPSTGLWTAEYRILINNPNGYNVDSIATGVKLIDPIQIIFYSDDSPYTYPANTDWFSFDFTFTFSGPDLNTLQNCDQWCLPEVMLQYDFTSGTYNSFDPHTGCDSSASSPQYCFYPCPCGSTPGTNVCLPARIENTTNRI